VSPVHGLVKYSDGGEISIFTLQGHPEFSPDIVCKIIDAREKSGVLPKELADESRKYAAERDEGIRLGGVVLSILGI
jgi:hypothetical protein